MEFILSIVASILAAIIIYIYRGSIRIIVSLTFYRKYTPYLGKFNFYSYFALDEDDKGMNLIHNHRMNIRGRFFRYPSIYLESKSYQHKGMLKIAGPNIYMQFSGLHHDEDMMYTFCKPISPDKFYILVGLKSFVTHYSEPVSNLGVLSKITLSDADVRQILGERKVMLLKKDYNHSQIKSILIKKSLDDSL